MQASQVDVRYWLKSTPNSLFPLISVIPFLWETAAIAEAIETAREPSQCLPTAIFLKTDLAHCGHTTCTLWAWEWMALD